MVVENPAARFFENAERTPEALALVCDEQAWSYQQLAERAAAIAHQVRLLSLALGRPARIALFIRESVELYAGLLGTLAGGGTYVPLSSNRDQRVIEALLELVAPDAAVGASPALRLLLPSLPRSFPDEKHACEEHPPALPPDHPVYILFTSGTTGAPKGVIIPARALSSFQAEFRRIYAFGPHERFGQFVDLTFDISLFELLGAWDAGASLHVVPHAWKATPDRFIRERALTVWTSTPSLIPVLCQSGRLAKGSLPTLATSIFCGEPLTVSDVEAWRSAAPSSNIDNHYGPTEATVACSFYRVPEVQPCRWPGRDVISVGRPYAETQLAVISPEGRFLAPGERGELAIAGPQLSLGYLRQASENFRRLTHPTRGTDRWYFTGDEGACDEAGNFYVLGRLDLQVKVLGHRIELEAIEAAIREQLGQPWAVALAWPQEGGRAQGTVAFIGWEAAKDWPQRLGLRLPAAVVPARLIAIENPPRTPHGKLDRAALARLIPEVPIAMNASAAVLSRTESWLVELWSRILGHTSVPVDRTFVELGGDSAGAIRVMAAIWDEFGEEISPDVLAQDPTVVGIARVIDQHRRIVSA